MMSLTLPQSYDQERTDRLNSLLKEVIAEVVMRDVRNPKVNTLVTIKKVEITKDLHHAKVYISLVGSRLRKTANPQSSPVSCWFYLDSKLLKKL